MSTVALGFFEHGKRRLFGAYHEPAQWQRRGDEERGHALLFCNGFAGEFLLVRSYFSRIAQSLTSHGHAIFRFDYAGYGDSEGDFVDATIDSMSADIERAIDELKAKAGVSTVSLLGVRFGGMLAARVAASRDDIVRLVLWEPVLTPWDYLYKLLRGTVTMQTVLFRGVKFNRQQIIDNLLAGKPSLADGYNMNFIDDGFPLSAPLLEQARAIDLLASPPELKADTLVVHVRRQPGELATPLATFAEAQTARGIRCDTAVAVEAVMPWKHERLFTTIAPDLCAKTCTWLER